jgi:predicted ArsR family transcriptional regulator
MPASDLERQIRAIALLDEPRRRRLYRYVLARRREVGRDEAARALRMSRALAAFHLDKLAEHGLLETSYRRLRHRRGPGAGRPAKLYRRSTRTLALALPARRDDLAAQILARAVAGGASTATQRAVGRAARATGRQLVHAARLSPHGRGLGRRRLGMALAVLDECGFEPTPSDGGVRLSNCPFAALAEQCRPLVCAMNLALVRGVLAGVRARGVRAELRPEAGACCVIIREGPRRR